MPLIFEINQRRLIFLQYILKQDQSSMIYKVLGATKEKPSRNDFVKTCDEYCQKIWLELSWEQIKEMSTLTFKKLVNNNQTLDPTLPAQNFTLF